MNTGARLASAQHPPYENKSQSVHSTHPAAHHILLFLFLHPLAWKHNVISMPLEAHPMKRRPCSYLTLQDSDTPG
ncbi:hypothetical protein AMECASPLE_017335 [Ameca splendens]|uniref:Uncharacterized protein n=1 Tax=Ameca splendens TaxID=208324 RepID=A0ABV0Y294_9TELE